MSANCPYCPPEPGYEGWGGSDEFWAEAKRIHDRDHTPGAAPSSTGDAER